MLACKVDKRLAFEIFLWPVHSSKNVTTYAKTLCFDAVICGHFKFFRSQGIVAERDDNRCPACYATFWKTNLSSWVLALQFFSEFLSASFFLEVFYVSLWSFYRLCVSLRFSLQSFRPHGNASNEKCAKITWLDSMIGGHAKLLLGTGKFCKRDGNCCPALQRFEKRAFSTVFANFFCEVFSVGILCVPLVFFSSCVSVRFSFPSCRTFFPVYVSGTAPEVDCHRQSAFEIVLMHETLHSVEVVRHVFWSRLLCGHSTFASGPWLLLGKLWK